MCAADDQERAQPAESEDTGGEEARAGSLVPLYASAIVPGVQAFRKGDIILYTIRGEPAQVLELVGQLDKEGVEEVVALISHPAQEEQPRPEEEEPDEEE